MANSISTNSGSTDIDPNGDVVLVVEGTRLRVSSNVLGLASPVWKAMFRPDYAEGTSLSKGAPCVILLPEDKADALSTLCNILHHRIRSIEKKPTAASLEQLAIITDKYDCVDALSFYSGLHLTRLMGSTKATRDIGRLLYPACTFNYPPVFQQVTKAMVYNTNHDTIVDIFGLSSHRTDSNIKGWLPDGLLEAIEEEQTNIKYTLLCGLEKILDPILDQIPARSGTPARTQTIHSPMYDPTYVSECKCNRVAMFLKELSKLGIWPISYAMTKLSLSAILGQLVSFSMVKLPADMGHRSSLCITCITDFNDAVSDLRVVAERAFHGYCLECVKHGRKGRFKCRKFDTGHSSEEVGRESDRR